MLSNDFRHKRIYHRCCLWFLTLWVFWFWLGTVCSRKRQVHFPQVLCLSTYREYPQQRKDFPVIVKSCICYWPLIYLCQVERCIAFQKYGFLELLGFWCPDAQFQYEHLCWVIFYFHLGLICNTIEIDSSCTFVFAWTNRILKLSVVITLSSS